MSLTKEKLDSLLLNRSDLWLVRRCHGILRVYCYYFCLEPTMRNDSWIKTTSVTAVAFFSKRAFWKLLDHSYVQSSFLTITGHIYSNLLKDTLQMNILRIWLNIRSKFFIKTLVNVMKRNSMKVAGKRSVAQNPIVHFEEHCTKTDLGSFILLFYTLLFLLNLVFKFTIALIGIFFGCFPHNLLSFLPFD